MQKNASGGQGLFVFYGREPKRPPFVRRGGTFALRSFVPALWSAGRRVEGSGRCGFCNINTKNKKFFQDKY